MSGNDDVLTGGGELGSLIRGIDWSATALGAVSSWPQSLRSALSICIGSRFPIAIYWGKELVLLYNDAWSPILGEKHPSSLGRPGRAVWPEIWDTIGPMFEQVMTTGEATYSEDSILLMHRHGYTEECYFNFTFSPVRGEAGRVEGIFNAVIETTYRVLAERRMRVLRELGERLALAASTDEVARFAIESLASAKADVPFCALYLVDDGGARATLTASGGIEAGTRFAPATIALDEDGASWPLRPAGRALRLHVVTDLKGRFGSLPPGGAWPEPASSAFVVPIALPSSDHAFGFLVLGASPRRAIDEQYKEFAEKAGSQLAASIASARRRDESAATDRAKTAFFSNVSHEFRTPLTLMLAPIEDLRSLNTADAETRDRVELLHRNALRLLKLVNDLLDFSRIEAGRAVATYRPTDLAALTADLASTFRSTIERAGLALVVDCPPLGDTVFVDRDMWEKIVLNLLSNSFKFTFEGVITVRLTRVAEAVVLEIRDTGTGISEREMPRLFERFHRIEGARSRSHEGSGIGLALVHELIRMHGGEIRVESRKGEGTTFFVQIPLGANHLAADRVLETEERKPFAAALAFVQEASRWISSASPHSSTPSAPLAISAAPRARIVLADDNADMRDYVSRLLREQWEVEAVADGHEALAAIRRDPPDLVLSDVMMPGLDGFGLLRAVRNDAVIASTPFVLLSARAGEEAAAEGLRAGADDYIIKPFTARELLVRVMARLSAAKASSEAEEQRKNLYRVLIQSPFPLAVFRGPEHVVELANEAMGKQWGKGPHVVGLPLREAVPEMVGQPFLGFLDDVYRTGVAHHGRGELARLGTGPNGALEDHYFNYVYAPLMSARGAIEGVMVCAFNVSEQVLAGQRIDAARARAEALASELRITSQRLEAAQRVGSIGIFDWDLRTERVFWSPELYELLGLEPGSVEPSAEAWSQRLHEEDRAPGWEAFREATAARRSNFEIEVRLKQPSGQRRWVRLTSSLDYDEMGAPTRLLGAVVDIEALKSAADVREAASRAKDEFLATMSHELRTPLNAMLGWAKILLADSRDPAKVERGLTVIERNARAQARLVDDLMDVSRIVSGKLRLTMRRIQISTVIHAAAEVIRATAESKGVRLVVDLDPEVGATVADPDRLQQIIWNLLSNAVRFTPAKGRVSVTAQRSASMVTIEVEDTGAGIASEHLPHIFERFRQVDSTITRAHGGLGLGLAIVRHLVEAHGGSVSATSAGLGTGARFTISLPISAVSLQDEGSAQGFSALAPDPSGTNAPRTQGVRLDGVHVLVVEDELDARELVRFVLETAGARVTTVASAREGLDAPGPFDIILSDIGMPEMDGYEFLRRMRGQPAGASAPALALTAYARAEDAERARRGGYQQHLAKPVDSVALVEAVRRWTRPSQDSMEG